ncbi:hypothetical protein [Yunchengibacter salinarum]|uniref:hypothetical protein n=1 Tax=Yunchengibacter salinarum TaxID=3133399 RepID=UPI0035B62ABD
MAEWRINKGLVISLSLHVGVAALAAVGLPHLGVQRPPPPPPIAVDYVKIADQTRVTEPETASAPEPDSEPTEEASKPKPAPSPQKSSPAPAPAPSAESADSMPLPDARPEPKAQKAPAPEPKPEVTARTRLRNSVSPAMKPRPPSRIRADRISALIDKSIKEEQSRTRPTDEDREQAAQPQEKKDQSPFLDQLRGRIATASLRDALSAKLEECWNFPGGAKNVDDMAVTVRIWLKPDGSLARPPAFVETQNMDDGFYRTFAESARRAVLMCEPYDEATDYIASGQRFIDFVFTGEEFGGT